MLREMPEAVCDEKTRLSALVLAKAREELELAFRIKCRGGFVSYQQSDVATHKAHKHARPSANHSVH